MRNRKKAWLLRRVVLGFAIVAVAAPVAQARIDEGTLVEKGIQLDNGVQLNEKFVQGGPGYSLHPVGAPWNMDSPTQVAQIHDRPVVGTGSNPVVAIHDRPSVEAPVGSQYSQFAYRRTLPQDYGVRTVAVSGKADGFDWGDAGIGAGALLGAMLLAGGATLASRRVGQTATA
jgi:hypothetical protein